MSFLAFQPKISREVSQVEKAIVAAERKGAGLRDYGGGSGGKLNICGLDHSGSETFNYDVG